MMHIAFLSLLAGVQAHTFFQKVSVNGVDQGDLFGVRVPNLNSPITDINDPNFACNSGIVHQDSNLISIPQGASVGTFWNHAIGDGLDPNDPDSPVASSHKGPIQVYLAAVPDAVGSTGQGLNWFKVGSEGLNNGAWAVDNMIKNAGWWTFTMPSCVTAGQYLMRAELLALHGAFNPGGAQFYSECAQIQVTGSGTSSPATVQFPGAYTASDPGILVSIYDGNGQPTMGGQPYTVPGPALIDCSGAGSAPAPAPVSSPVASPAPTTMKTSAIPKPTTAPSPVVANPASSYGSGSTAAILTQCGGEGWTGPTVCASGTCTVANQWFSQCLP